MKIICFGDSLTYGYGVDISKSWVEILKKNSNMQIINKGVNGDTAVGLLSRSYGDVIEEKPSNVIMMIGTNDFLSGRSIDKVKESVIELIKEFRNYGINTIIGIQPPIVKSMAEKYWSGDINYDIANNNILEYKRWVIDYLSNIYNIKYLDFHTLICTKIDFDLPDKYYIDGIHLTDDGHKIIAAYIISSLSKF